METMHIDEWLANKKQHLKQRTIERLTNKGNKVNNDVYKLKVKQIVEKVERGDNNG